MRASRLSISRRIIWMITGNDYKSSFFYASLKALHYVTCVTVSLIPKKTENTWSGVLLFEKITHDHVIK